MTTARSGGSCQQHVHTQQQGATQGAMFIVKAIAPASAAGYLDPRAVSSKLTGSQPCLLTFLPDLLTFLPDLLTFLPDLLTFLPDLLTFLPDLLTFLPDLLTFLPDLLTFLPCLLTVFACLQATHLFIPSSCGSKSTF
jgi:hypothetical protein